MPLVASMSSSSITTLDKESSSLPPPSSPPIQTISSFLTNIIDCIALPSTSDSPIRLLRKSYSDASPSDSESLLQCDSRSEATAIPIAEAVEPYEEDDTSVAAASQQFEAAFATFLYKNPAFTSMSHGNLTRMRTKMAKESARNARAEAELRGQLEMLREKKRMTELELQRELVVVTRAKAAKEAELRNQIWRVRRAGMAVEEELRRVRREGGGSVWMTPTRSVVETDSSSIRSLSPMALSPEISDTDSFQEELYRTRIEYERLSGEMERLKEIIDEGAWTPNHSFQ